ncbi:MAG: hypothetical protein ABSA84_02625 [Gammaproteobacteria bacterium]
MKLVLLPDQYNQYSLSIYLNKDNYEIQIQEAIGLINDAIVQGKQIEYVSFYDSQFSVVKKENLLPLFEAIKKAKVHSLGFVAVNINHITVSKTQEILDLIVDACKNGGVDKVDLSRNCIGNASLEQQRAIVERVSKMVPYIKEIDLSFNNLEKLQEDMLLRLFVSCTQSTRLDVINLDYNQLVPQEESPEKAGEIGLKFLSHLFKEKREEHKWKTLSIAGTDLSFLSHKEWVLLLNNIEKCCESINLSHNSLQECTREGHLDVYEKQDLIQIIAEWLESTKLKMVDLTHNKFSVRNTILLVEATKGKKFVVEAGNKLPNNSNYERLLKLEELEQEDSFEAAQQHQSLPLFYMHEAIPTSASQPQEDPIQIEASDLEEQVVIFMQNLAKKNPAVLQTISMQDLLTAINSVFVSHNVRVNAPLSSVANNSTVIKTPDQR